MKVVRILQKRPADLDPYVVDYYPSHEEYSKLIRVLRDLFFRDEHLDFKEGKGCLKIFGKKKAPKTRRREKKLKPREIN
ncbi:hypothetical protein TNIN_99881 [Trichonephila inaurata madagascariensis]|uniref:Uncharacterized protein n=1 Tax=Trichonephila inaurata madagascariensis TaxID=2747483 RepID=A0A8X7CPJ8_9ARAC|nr:hypothetical protein TNIN_99881 [Trichonephila inaurata madagascariensis]